jgi:hypothetical protein
MTEYSRVAEGRFVSAGAAKIINLPFQPDSVEMWNYSSFATPAQNGVPYAYWDASMGQGYAAMQVFNATPVLTTDVVTSNGISTFAAGQLLQYGARIQISGITKASPAVVTTAANHGYASGDVVIFTGLYQSATTGMPQICEIPFTITVTGATTFTIPWNTNQTNYTALSGSPSGAFVKKVLYPYLYTPGVAFVSAITTGTTTTIDTTSAHNFVVGQEVAFRVPSVWGTIQLNSLPNNNTPGSPVYGYVVAVTDYNTVVVNINSSSYTAFNSNQPVSGVPGQSFAQIVAVGDVNTGGAPISSGSALYPSPYVTPIGTTQVNTINGPAIQGAFVNNSSQGFIIGAGVGATLSSAVLVGANGNVIYWKAYLSDLSV